MNSFNSLATGKISGNRVSLFVSLLIVAMCCYGYFTVAFISSDDNRAHFNRLIDQVGASSNQDVDDPGQVLVNLRLLLPQLATLDPASMVALKRSVDISESILLEQTRSGGATDKVLSELAGINKAMYQRAISDWQRARELKDFIASLSVLFSLGVFAWVLISKLRTNATTRISSTSLGELIFNNVAVPLVVTDTADRISAVNEAYLRMTGYAEMEILGKGLTFNQAGQNDERTGEVMRTKLSEEGRWSGDFKLRNKKGEVISDKVTRIRINAEDGSVSGYLTVSSDVASTEASQKRMMWQAHHDLLTKLPNRNLFQERLTRVVLQAQSTGMNSALISIDLDRFKIVNDSVGATKADQVLMEAGYRIAMCVRESDTVARLGSDHFAVVLSEGDYHEAQRISRNIVETIRKPFLLEDRELFITSSVGVSIIPQDGENTGELLQKADAARIQIKESGGNAVAFFEPEINARAKHRMGLESGLRHAIADNQLLLYYQPVVDLTRNEVTKAEALIRWQHPELGMVSPGEFIPIAEDTGLIIEIGKWVVQEVQRQLQSWQAAGLAELSVSLNVSPVQLKSEANIDTLLECLTEPVSNNLILELTESALIDNSEGVQNFLKRARALGCKIALDDFGTGFSSLGYLRNFEFDLLKIDKTFIDELENPRDHGLVASIISMSRILGMRVVAEGVEESSQVQSLRQIGCDYIQGYYYSRPLPADEFFEFIANGGLRDVG